MVWAFCCRAEPTRDLYVSNLVSSCRLQDVFFAILGKMPAEMTKYCGSVHPDKQALEFIHPNRISLAMSVHGSHLRNRVSSR